MSEPHIFSFSGISSIRIERNGHVCGIRGCHCQHVMSTPIAHAQNTARTSSCMTGKRNRCRVSELRKDRQEHKSAPRERGTSVAELMIPFVAGGVATM